MDETTPARRHSWAEPYKIKAVEHIRRTTRDEREAALARPGGTPSSCAADDVFIDLLTDSGTNAMSAEQWAALMLGDEAYAGSENFFHLKQAVAATSTATRYVVPTHQGRGAEHIISQMLIKPGESSPGTCTSRPPGCTRSSPAARFVDVIVDEAHDPVDASPFKGNVDLAQARARLRRARRRAHPLRLARRHGEHGRRAAGQRRQPPRGPGAVRRHGIMLYLDTTRIAENALFIQQREAGLPGHPGGGRSCARSATSPTAPIQRRRTRWSTSAATWPCATRSSSRRPATCASSTRASTRTGAWPGATWRRCHRHPRESSTTTTCSAPRRPGRVPRQQPPRRRRADRACRSAGTRCSSTRAVPAAPPQEQFPAQRLAGEIYLEAGVRSMERGIVSAGRDAETGEHNRPRLELVRLTHPAAGLHAGAHGRGRRGRARRLGQARGRPRP